MRLSFFTFCLTVTVLFQATNADARTPIEKNPLNLLQASALLTPHKAIYNINLVATRSGSQVINISGKMFYEWKPSCEAWVTDHRFNLRYEYADSPAVSISSDFSTYETYGGNSFDFSARRKRDDVLYQELRGHAGVTADKTSKASFTIPEKLNFELNDNVMFPMAHTVEMIARAQAGQKIFHATVFDGSDDEGPVEINSFIGAPVNAMQVLEPSEAIDMALVNTPAWNVRMAVFPSLDESAPSDYEMSMVFHENGVISDMLIDYDDFSVTQKLVALERLPATSCENQQKKQ